MAKFVVTISVAGKRQKKKIDAESFSLGRSRENQVTIIHSGISRKHLILTQKGHQVFLEDTGSTNGTIVAGEKLDPRSQTPYTFGDEILLGTCPASIVITLEEGEILGVAPAQEENLEEEEIDVSTMERTGIKADYFLKDFDSLPEMELGSPREESAIRVDLDVPGGGQMFDFDADEDKTDQKLNLEVSLGSSNAFVRIDNGRCTIGSGNVDFKVEDPTIAEHHATFFQVNQTLVMVLHEGGKATFKRKRLKNDHQYILFKGVVLHLENLIVKVVEGETLQLNAVQAKGIKALLDEEGPEEEEVVEEEDIEEVKLPIEEQIKEVATAVFHYLTFDLFKPKPVDFDDEEDDEDEEEPAGKVIAQRDDVEEDDEDDDEDEVEIEKQSLWSWIKGLLLGKKKKAESEEDDDEEDDEKPKNLKSEEESDQEDEVEDDDEDGESDEDGEKKSLLDKLNDLLGPSDDSEFKNMTVAAPWPRILANCYDFLVGAVVYIFLGSTGVDIFGIAEYAPYHDMAIYAIVVQLVITLVLGRTLGQLLIGVDSYHVGRVAPFKRLLIGFITIPLLPLEVGVLTGKPSIKEKMSQTRLVFSSKFRFSTALVILVPLALAINIYISVQKAGEEFDKTRIVKNLLDKKENFEVTPDSKQIISRYFGIEVISDIHQHNIEVIPFVTKKNATIYFLDLNGYGLFSFERLKLFSIKKLISTVGKNNPMLSSKFPRLARKYETGIPANYEFTPQEKKEIADFTKVALELNFDSLIDHIINYGPFITGFLEYRKELLSIVKGELPADIDIVHLGDNIFLRFMFKKTKDSIMESYLSLSLSEGSLWTLSTKRNLKAITLHTLINKKFLQGFRWSKARKSDEQDLAMRETDRFWLLDFLNTKKPLLEEDQERLLVFVREDLRALKNHSSIEPSANRELFSAFYEKLTGHYGKILKVDPNILTSE